MVKQGGKDVEGLRRMRKAAGLTQHELGELVGVKLLAVCQWEKGAFSPRLKRLKQLAELFGCSIEDLF